MSMIDWDDLALNYNERVISPFSPNVRFPLRKDIREKLEVWRKSKCLKNKIAIDFGCGCGDALLYLSGKIGLSVGIDFSSGMLNESYNKLINNNKDTETFFQKNSLIKLSNYIYSLKKKSIEPFHTVLVKANLLKLYQIHTTADLSLAINSISQTDIEEVNEIFQQITYSTKRNGTFIAVFPSLDTMYYLKKLSEKKQIELPELGEWTSDGIYQDSSGDEQRFFRPDEIINLFERFKWKLIKMQKIYYSWNMIKRFGWGYFPYHERVWDWYIVARK